MPRRMMHVKRGTGTETVMKCTLKYIINIEIEGGGGGGQWEGKDGEGAMGKGETGKGVKGEGENKEQEERRFHRWR